MLKDTLSSILGLATAFLLLGGIILGVTIFNKTDTVTVVENDIDVVENITTEEPLDTANEEFHSEAIINTSEDTLSTEIPIAENYEEIISNPEEMEYRQEIIDEIVQELPQEYINPNAAAGREHILTEADFDDYDSFMEWYIANQDRPFDIDGYFTDVPDYEPIIDPNANVIAVEGIVFDHEGNVLSKEEAESLEIEGECYE